MYCITNGDRPACPGATLLFGGGADKGLSSAVLFRLTQGPWSSFMNPRLVEPCSFDLLQGGVYIPKSNEGVFSHKDYQVGSSTACCVIIWVIFELGLLLCSSLRDIELQMYEKLFM